ncbi:MAG: DUF4276 family protein [Dehalococcoidia bacterium]
MDGEHASVFLTRVVIRGYRSIAACDVTLGPLTFLVGPNGAGKSNVLDALSFAADALRHGLPEAIGTRGGLATLLHDGVRQADEFGVRLEFRLSDSGSGHYAFTIGVRNGDPVVRREECVIHAGGDNDGADAWFRVNDGSVAMSAGLTPAAAADRLFLVAASGLPAFWRLHTALTAMRFYNIVPDELRGGKAHVGPPLLSRGENGATVLSRIAAQAPDVKRYIDEYLTAINPDIVEVNAHDVGVWDALELRTRGIEDGVGRSFSAYSMSNGTLRALGILLALFQKRALPSLAIPLIGIEEPEAALHPGALAVLLDALRDAATDTQVLVTTHSTDLLDSRDISDREILSVHMGEDGATHIGPIAPSTVRPCAMVSRPRATCSASPPPRGRAAGRRRRRFKQRRFVWCAGDQVTVGRIRCIVEGEGEVRSAPVLVRRIAETLDPPTWPDVGVSVRRHRSALLSGAIESDLPIAAREAGAGGAILLLIDADDDCPAKLGPALLRHATELRLDRHVGVVLANHEFENWFIAAAESLRGRRGLASDLTAPADPERVRGAKEWLSRRLPPGRSYRPTVDQPGLTAAFDLDLARRRSDSFDKCVREIARLLRAVAAG